MFRRAYTPHTAPHLASSSPTSRPTIQASAVHGAESFFLLFFFFCLSAPFVRACRTACARSCSPHVWRQIRERAREREQLRDHLHVCVAALTFPPLFTPNHITIRSLTLGTNILADLWQTSHHPHHHHPPFSSLSPLPNTPPPPPAPLSSAFLSNHREGIYWG